MCFTSRNKKKKKHDTYPNGIHLANVLSFISWILMSYYAWQQYLRRNPTWTISFQQSEDKRRTSTSIHKPFAASATGGAEITQVLEPKTRRLFICRFLSRRNDMHSGAVQPSVFLNTVIPLSISFPHSLLLLQTAHRPLLLLLLFFLSCFSVVPLDVATHCTARCNVRLFASSRSDGLKGD